MKVLVIGKGGREHALVRALTFSASVNEVHALPGNDGMKGEVLCHDVSPTNLNAVYEVIKRNNIDLVVIGPEADLVSGLPDFLRAKDVLVVAPSQSASQLESSKIFSKEFMVAAEVPTASFAIVNSVEGCLEASKKFTAPFVLKADGLAAGKGVFICANLDELRSAAVQLFEMKSLGEAGSRALLEEFQPGWEISYLVLTNGSDFKSLPLSQDHKRLLEGNAGPNTGGMGVIGPMNIKLSLEERIHNEILQPTIRELQKQNLLYRGVLYFGIMVTKDGPKVLEYNTRFGDPEAQVILPLLDGDWGLVFKSLAQGNLPEVNWKPLCACCVVLAAEGYPNQPKSGVVIDGNIKHQTPSSYFLHAGTKLNAEGDYVTNGGRVLNSIGIGSSLAEAIKEAYQQAGKVNWPGMQMRSDIGKSFLQ